MIHPSEFESVEFKTSVMGYTPEQVDDFMDHILSSYTEAYKLNIELQDECNSLKEKISILENKSDKITDQAKLNYNEYVEKLNQLKKMIADFKSQIYSFYQSQITQIQNFDFNAQDVIPYEIGNSADSNTAENVDRLITEISGLIDLKNEK